MSSAATAWLRSSTRVGSCIASPPGSCVSACFPAQNFGLLQQVKSFPTPISLCRRQHESGLVVQAATQTILSSFALQRGLLRFLVGALFLGFGNSGAMHCFHSALSGIVGPMIGLDGKIARDHAPHD